MSAWKWILFGGLTAIAAWRIWPLWQQLKYVDKVLCQPFEDASACEAHKKARINYCVHNLREDICRKPETSVVIYPREMRGAPITVERLE